MIKALCYKLEDQDSIPNSVIGILNLPNLSSRVMALGSTQTLTEMITKNPAEGKGLPAGQSVRQAKLPQTVVRLLRKSASLEVS